MKTRERMILDNLGLAGMVARKYIGAKHEYDDLFQVGCIGLMIAADKFDPDKGFQFSTFATRVINLEILKYFRPLNKHDNQLSLNMPLNDNGTEFQDLLESDVDLETEVVERFQYFGYVDDLKTLPFSKCENECMRLRCKGLRQHQIGVITGTSQTQISRHLRSAKKKVEAMLKGEGQSC